MIEIRTNHISEKQLAQIALEIQNRWDVPTFVKMHEIIVAEDDLEPRASHELFQDFENGLSIIFENLQITAAFRLRRTGKLRYEIERIPGTDLPGWMAEIEETPRVPEGVYECPHCVLPDTLILGDNKPIAEYSKGNSVIGQTGLNQVMSTFVRPYNGKILTVRANGMLPITITPEHPILASSSKTTETHRKGKYRYQLDFSEESWTQAKKLRAKTFSADGDYLVVPIIKGTFHEKQINLSPFIIAQKPKHRGYLAEFPLSEDTSWLLGLYVAEGSVTDKEARFSLSSQEEEIKVRIESIVCKLGNSTYVRCSDAANSMLLSIPSRVLARAFDAWCGHGASNKEIPDFVLCHEDLSILRAFLKGYEAGDSYTHTKRSKRSPGYRSSSTVSKILAQQLQLAYARLGIWANVGIREYAGEGLIMGRKCSLHTKYSVSYSLEPNPKRRRVRFLGERILSPIRQITEEDYSGSVHNLETSDNTYLVSNAIVHNCGRRFPTDIQLSLHTKLHYIT
ncbi:MAG TPA: LAGLIDADG family homing endonuclease [Nitrososphaerales archaeon]|nr:LAGLIDADG family homing endonuclease [Nitrososphaerales archaeon]